MRFEAPETVEAAVGLLAAEKGLARPLAGGTDLLVQMKSGRIEPDLVVDLKRIPSMRAITEEDGGFRIGGAVSCAELNEHAALMAAWPGVTEAADLIGSTQIQGRATVVGNLCNASPAGDSGPAMAAAGAIARIAGPEGFRELPVEDVAEGPGKTALARYEIVESVFLPAPGAHTGSAYQRFIPRTEMDIAVVGAGVCLTLDDAGVCTAARVALGAVAARMILVEAAAQALIGSTVDDAALDAVAKAASEAATPIDDKRGTVEFRVKVAGVLARRATQSALSRAKGA